METAMAEQTDNLILCGIKHCGKSTLGRLLADEFGVEFFDSDEALSAIYRSRTGRQATPREIFIAEGENFFRQLEADTIGLLAKNVRARRVIALGGGVADNPRIDAAALARLGTFVYLAIDPEIAYRRIEAGGLPPFLADEADPQGAFLRLHEKRDRLYRQLAKLVFPIDREIPPPEQLALFVAFLREQGVL